MRATTMPLRPMSDDPARAWRLALLNASLGALFLALVPAAFFLVAAHPWAMLVTIPVNACAFTGLFILAHEAIHGTLLPGFPRLGHALGRLFATVYALVDYDLLRENHWKHHGHVATEGDPDYDGDGLLVLHAARFMRRYLRWYAIPCLATAGHLLGQAGYTAAMLGAYVVPVLLSTLVVFTVGIHLVHHPELLRTRAPGDPQRSVCIDLGRFGSAVLILNFNVHWHHHAHPRLSWWELGSMREEEPVRVSVAEAWRALRLF
jgi:beta-carotene/zeaxanthin 4-ketolase